MSGNERYVRRMIGQELRDKLTSTLAPQFGDKAPTVVQFMDDNMILGKTGVLHYLVWVQYRHDLTSTSDTPNDIMQNLAAAYDIDVRTVRRIVKKMTPRVLIR